MQVAQDMGLKVEKRPLPVSEVRHIFWYICGFAFFYVGFTSCIIVFFCFKLMEGEFTEVAACGTAVILTAVKEIVFSDKVIKFAQYPDDVGPVTRQLYETICGIQTGDLPDKYGWMTEVSLDK